MIFGPDQRILIVDDEPFMREVVQDILIDMAEINANCIDCVENGAEGWDAFQKGSYALVITDMVMPEMSGDMLVQKIRSVNQDVHVLVMTGYADLQLAVEVIARGIDALIRKPFQPKEILFELNRIKDKVAMKHAHDEMQEKLVSSEKFSSLGILAAGIAHEINNPTAFVKGNLELSKKYLEILWPRLEKALDGQELNIKEKIAFESIKEITDTAIEGCNRIKTITSTMLSFSRTKPTERAVVDVHQILDHALTLTQHRVKVHDVVRERVEGLRKIIVNEQDLVQSFMNLFVNAIDAIEDKRAKMGLTQKGTLTIQVMDDQTRKCQVVIVRDSGTGMSEETLKKIFDPFYTTKPVGKGTGLGMGITRSNIEKNGGTVDCSSVLGEGTTFEITLPWAP